MCIVLYDTILATAIDRASDRGFSADGHISLAGQCLRLDKINIFVHSWEIFPDIFMCFIRKFPNILVCSIICLRIIGHHTFGPMRIICISINFRQDSLTSTKHIASVSLGSHFGMVSNDDCTLTRILIVYGCQCIRHSYL